MYTALNSSTIILPRSNLRKNTMRRILLALFAALVCANVALAATLMPPGKLQFFDNNGNPLTSGQVFFYVPSTTTPKNTWQDSGQTILNTNPVTLDGGGFAIIYGSGNYRMIVKDSLGNTVYDQLTASTPEGSVTNIFYYASSTAGALNAVVVSAATPSDYSLTTGKTLRFISPLSNTGSTTLNALSLGTITFKRATASAGLVNLAGGEIVSGGTYDAMYDGTNYVLLNPSITDNPGDIKAFGGATAPSGYNLCDGSSQLRAGQFSSLFAAVGTAWGAVDGTHFNVPDLRGTVPAGKDNMGGVAANRLTNAGSGVAGDTLATISGDQLMQLHTHAPTDPGHLHAANQPNVNNVSGVSGANFDANSGLAATNTGSSTTGITIANTGTGTKQNVQPTSIVNFLCRL